MELDLTITKVQSDLTYYGKMIENKEVMMVDDSQVIIEFLMKNEGVMNLTSESSSESVMELLHMSRKAFKRALGSLYKRKLVSFKDNKTYLERGLHNAKKSE
jgi:predicted RNA-binding protein (virulence factor B family)